MNDFIQHVVQHIAPVSVCFTDASKTPLDLISVVWTWIVVPNLGCDDLGPRIVLHCNSRAA